MFIGLMEELGAHNYKYDKVSKIVRRSEYKHCIPEKPKIFE